MFKFIFSKTFIINLLIAIVLSAVVIWGIFKFIDSYTHHGETISVPSVEGLTVEETKSILEEKKLRYTILDSIYVPNAEKGVVLDQNPRKDDLVKENRTIYITISKVVPPKKQIPKDLIGNFSNRLAIAKLKNIGFKIGKIIPIPGNPNVVLKMDIKGKEINNADWVDANSIINITVGSGTNGTKILAPYLIGLTKKEAKQKLMEASLNLGYTDYKNCKTASDTLKARVYKQSPISNKNIAVNMGSDVDLSLTCDTSLIHINPSPIKTDSSKTDSVTGG